MREDIIAGTPARPPALSPHAEVFILTSPELQALIKQAAEPLKEELRELRRQVDEHDALIDNHATAINMVWGAVKSRPLVESRGKKTQARISQIDEILKTRGATTLKELEWILKIDRATMTRLLGKLDKRRFEVHSRPGDGREKVLRFKATIR